MSTDKNTTSKRNDARDPKSGGDRPQRHENFAKHSPVIKGTDNKKKKGK